MSNNYLYRLLLLCVNQYCKSLVLILKCLLKMSCKCCSPNAALIKQPKMQMGLSKRIQDVTSLKNCSLQFIIENSASKEIFSGIQNIAKTHLNNNFQ